MPRQIASNSKGQHYSYLMHLPQRWFVVATAFLLLVATNLLPHVSAREAAVDLTFSVSQSGTAALSSRFKPDADPLLEFADDQPTTELQCSNEGATRFDDAASEIQTCLPFDNLDLSQNSDLYWSYPIQKDAQLRISVNSLLGGYFRNFASLAEQTTYEEKITSNFEYAAFVSALVRMDEKDFPGFSEQVSNTVSLQDAIRPWATQIAIHRKLPLNAFVTIGNGILYALGKSGDVTQERFDALLKKSDDMAVYANQVDASYQLASVFPSDEKTVSRYMFIDSLASKSQIDARQAYLNMAIRNAIRIHPEMQKQLESGLTVAQILKTKTTKSSAAFLKSVKTKAPTARP